MTDLEKLSTAEIEAALKQRKREAIEALKPKQIANPDLTNLREICQEYIDCFANGDWVSDDTHYWVYEAALKAIYGNEVFASLRKIKAQLDG